MSLSVAALFSATQFAHAIPSASPTTIVSVGGVSYELTTVRTSFSSSASLLESQLWWGNATLAFDLADATKLMLGDYNGNIPAQTTTGPFFAYDENFNHVSMAYLSNNNTRDCPGCPSSFQDYTYVIGKLVELGYTLEQAVSSINASTLGLGVTMSSVGTLVNGAHSRPMSRRVAVGQKTFWTAGDLGNDNHGSRDGSFGLAEIGGGYNFGPAQVNVSAGRTWAKQDLINNGDIDARGNYLIVETILPLSTENGLFATIGAYRHWGDVDIDRGYLNGNVAETSSASPDSNSWGVRARIDWVDAYQVQNIRFSPYADFLHNNSKLDSYRETGGNFPARFDSREDSINELRAGLNTVMPIKKSGFDFVANIEAIHRFEDKSDTTSGQVVGLFSFSLDGQDYDQNWFKGGVGVEGKLGKSRVSLMLNGTTEGEMPSSWLAASYQMVF